MSDATFPFHTLFGSARRAPATLVALLVALLPTLAPGAAHAETLLTGFAGVAFGGSTDESRGTYGGALGFAGDVFGFEVEFATTPDFFGSGGEGVFTDNNVLTLMGSFLVATPPSSVRAYGAFGAGLLKTRLGDPDGLFDVDSNDFGINVGGGLLVALGDHFSLRGDVRYFRDLQDDEPDGDFDIDFGQVDYWRAVGGITLRF
jgi:opacity protein-like surface antigen